MKKNVAIDYFDVVPLHETKAKKKEKVRKREKQGTKKKQKRKTRRKEKGQEQERDREREIEKRGGQKRLRRNKGRHSKINKKCPFLGENKVFFVVFKSEERKGNKKNKNKTNQRKKGGFRAKWGGPLGHLTLPLNPPKKTKKTKKTKTQKQQKTNKEGYGPSGHLTWPLNPPKKTKKQKTKKTNKKHTKKLKNTKTPKKIFSVISQFFRGGVQKLPVLTTWPRKRAPPKHYKNMGFQPFFWKKLCVTKRPFLDQKKPKSINSSYHCFFAFFSLQQEKNTQISWNPYFYNVLTHLKKENFQILNLKHRKLKNPNFAPSFLKKVIFW